jgi:hypothetical protein
VLSMIGASNKTAFNAVEVPTSEITGEVLTTPPETVETLYANRGNGWSPHRAGVVGLLYRLLNAMRLACVAEPCGIEPKNDVIGIAIRQGNRRERIIGPLCGKLSDWNSSIAECNGPIPIIRSGVD